MALQRRQQSAWRNSPGYNALTIHSIKSGTAHLFQVRPVTPVTDLSMYILDRSVEGGACE